MAATAATAGHGHSALCLGRGGGFADRVWLTRGYGSRIELVDARASRVLRVRRAPYGSFNLEPRRG